MASYAETLPHVSWSLGEHPDQGSPEDYLHRAGGNEAVAVALWEEDIPESTRKKIPVTDEERRIYTADNISAAMEKHYGRGYGHSPVEGPLSEDASAVENQIIINREEYGAQNDSFRSDFVRNLVLGSLVARVSRRNDA